MPRLAPKPLQLTQEEREQLQQIVSRHKTSQQIALRARIILLADEGCNHREIARDLKISREMASLWRNRWLELSVKNSQVLERLADAERPGGPMSFSLEQILQLFALACEKPEVYGRPISHWSARELADEALKQGLVTSISPRHVGRLMAEADLKPHQSQYWLNPPPIHSLMKKSKISARST
ncbi:helix-turn-helix domain-containing protein [Microcoleus sp. F10-C6]|uniref:helix-turn-helix domain-containing protein n=1 Tax=unclassified Microcoleus TaxID=2642155 RepID=UPI002FD4C3A2